MGPPNLFEKIWYRMAVDTNRITRPFARGPQRIPRECNLCGYHGYFNMAGKGTRPDAKCPRCNSVERHRLFKLWFDRNRIIFEGRDVLHFAPERSIARLIRPLARSYLSADITPGRADRVLNLEALEVDDQSFDCVVCLHVLEHVDDARALREIHRVLRPGGSSIIMVPVVEGWAQTYEDATVTTARERALHFGQADHLRIYGADVRTRIRNAGFDLTEFTAWGPDVLRYGLLSGEKVFLAAQRAGSNAPTTM
ncbi:MAG TPA: class I SAM-dependent methyltransferase [Rhizomicrobium sp.]|nr:class I SAM-dependent methyltransferase [Rhizomicrobium sp.]